MIMKPYLAVDEIWTYMPPVYTHEDVVRLVRLYCAVRCRPTRQDMADIAEVLAVWRDEVAAQRGYYPAWIVYQHIDTPYTKRYQDIATLIDDIVQRQCRSRYRQPYDSLAWLIAAALATRGVEILGTLNKKSNALRVWLLLVQQESEEVAE